MNVLWKATRPGAQMPTRRVEGDAGYDLSVYSDCVLRSGRLEDISTGIAVALPEGYWGKLCGRSSSMSRGIWVVEGIIDQGYRGELLIRVCTAPGQGFVRILAGERIAQLILMPLVVADWKQVEQLPPSARGDSGFGSTGR